MVVAALCFFDQTGRSVNTRKGCVLSICKEQQSQLGRLAVVLDGPHHGVHSNDLSDSKVYTACNNVECVTSQVSAYGASK